MSSSYALRSDGSPYIAAVSGLIGNAVAPACDLTAAYGVILLEFALHGLPTKLSSDDECHPLFSYHEWGPGGQDLAYLGVSPNGRLIGGSAAATTTLATEPGAVVPDSQFRKYAYLFAKDDDKFCEWRFVAGSGSSFEYLNPFLARLYGADSNDLASLAPAQSRYGTIMLFNGRTGISRASVSIREAIFAGTTSSPYWPMNDKAGTAVTAAATYNGGDLLFDGTLQAQQYYPPNAGVYAQPWGTPDGSDIYRHVRWTMKTVYDRQDRTHTIYARSAA